MFQVDQDLNQVQGTKQNFKIDRKGSLNINFHQTYENKGKDGDSSEFSLDESSIIPDFQ